MRILVAVILSAALIGLVPKHDTPVNNLGLKAAITKPARQVHQTVTAPAKEVKQVETPATQTAKTQPEITVAVTPPTPVPTTHDELMAAAGIQPADYGAVDYIVSHESSWDVNATEPTTGAHGLPQALPYSKTGCGWVDAVCQLSWANRYAISRYGGWWPAQAYWAIYRNW